MHFKNIRHDLFNWTKPKVAKLLFFYTITFLVAKLFYKY